MHRVTSSDNGIDTKSLEANHEEADTRIVLHASRVPADVVVITSRDTDVLVLLVAHRKAIRADEVWLNRGTAKAPLYIPIHTVYATQPPEVVTTILAFHALTGCDTTSFFAGHTKSGAWKTYKEGDNSQLLHGFGTTGPSRNLPPGPESFICRMYGAEDSVSADDARLQLLLRGRAIEKLPPSSAALQQHLLRAQIQTSIWEQATKQNIETATPTECGWQLHNEVLVPVLTTQAPAPSAYTKHARCACKSTCSSRCGCRKIGLYCHPACACQKAGCCINRREMRVQEQEEVEPDASASRPGSPRLAPSVARGGKRPMEETAARRTRKRQKRMATHEEICDADEVVPCTSFSAHLTDYGSPPPPEICDGPPPDIRAGPPP